MSDYTVFIRGRVIFLGFVLTLGFFSFGHCGEEINGTLEPIVVSKAGRHPMPSYQVKQSVFQFFPIHSPLESLHTQPVDLQARSPQGTIQSDFSLRGSTFQDVLILVNGQKVNDPQTGHHNSDIPLTKADVERIDVLPGAASSLFGPDAIGGAINFLVKKPQEKKNIFEGSFGSHRTGYGLLSLSGKKDILAARISLEDHESAGFCYGTEFHKRTAAFSSVLDLPRGEGELSYGYQEKEFGAYDFYTPGSKYPSKEWTRTHLVSTGVKWDAGGFVVKPGFLWRRHFDKFMLDKTSQRSRYLNHHRTDLFTPSVYAQKDVVLLGKVGLGAEYGEERIESTTLGKFSRNHRSVYFDDTKEFNDLFTSGFSMRMDDFEGFNRAYTGSVSSKLKISRHQSLNSGVSRSIRVPSFTELFYADPTTLGQAGLSPELALNYQAGYEYSKDKISGTGTVFLRQENDMIDWVKRSPSQSKWQADNIKGADVFGVEGRFHCKVSRLLDVDSNYTFVNKRIKDEGLQYKYGPNYLKHLWNGSLNLNLPFGVQSCTFTYKKKPGREGWFLFGARFSYTLNKSSQVFLSGTNLFNTDYQEIVGIPQPGRWLEIGFRSEW